MWRMKTDQLHFYCCSCSHSSPLSCYLQTNLSNIHSNTRICNNSKLWKYLHHADTSTRRNTKQNPRRSTRRNTHVQPCWRTLPLSQVQIEGQTGKTQMSQILDSQMIIVSFGWQWFQKTYPWLDDRGKKRHWWQYWRNVVNKKSEENGNYWRRPFRGWGGKGRGDGNQSSRCTCQGFVARPAQFLIIMWIII